MNRKLIVAAIAATTLAVGGTAAALNSPGDTKDSAGEPNAPAPVSLSDTDDDIDDDNGRDDDGDDDARELAKAKITAQQALEKALSAVPGTAESIELDDDNGGLVWDADIFGKDQKWHDVTVDADTGKVLTNHVGQDDADDDGDDRDDRDARDDDHDD